jgi:acetyl esterase/lipase
VLFVHGGGWSEGHPFAHIRRACLLAACGYVTATASYRLAPEAIWPAALEDVKCAVRWLRASSESIGLDPDRVAIAGDSAGGHLAAMVALTPGRFEGRGGQGGQPSGVQAAILFYPATDLRLSGEAAERALRFLGGSTRFVAEASPITYVTPASPPILTMTGAEDPIIPVSAVKAFHAALDEQGVPNELEVYERLGHGFDWHPAEWERSFARLCSFLQHHLPAG